MSTSGTVPDALPRSLRRQAWGISLAFGGGLVLYAGWMLAIQMPGAWLRMGLAILTAGLGLGYLWWNLRHNHAPDRTVLFNGLGWGNGITLLRLFLIVLLAGAIVPLDLSGWMRWAVTLLWVTSSLLDLVDGWLARRTGRVTVLGEKLDMETDGVSVVVAALVGMGQGTLPVWFLAIALLRPLFVGALAWRTRQGHASGTWPESQRRRLVAALQWVFLGGALWPDLSEPLLATAIWLVSLALVGSFGRDWLWTTGVLDPQVPRLWRWYERSRKALTEWVPVSLRPLTALGVLTALADRGDAMPDTLSLVLALICALTVPPILAGIRPRVVAMLLLVCTGLLSTRIPYVPSMSLMVLGSMYLFVAGGGRFAWSLGRKSRTQA